MAEFFIKEGDPDAMPFVCESEEEYAALDRAVAFCNAMNAALKGPGKDMADREVFMSILGMLSGAMKRMEKKDRIACTGMMLQLLQQQGFMDEALGEAKAQAGRRGIN